MDFPKPSLKLATGKKFALIKSKAVFRLACSLLELSVLLSGLAVLLALLNAPEPVLDMAWVAIVLAIPFPAVGTLILFRHPPAGLRSAPPSPR